MLRALFVILAIWGAATDVNAQEIDKDSIYSVVDEIAKFKKGDEALQKFLSENIHYPKIAQERGVQGRVFVIFVIERNGAVSDVGIKRLQNAQGYEDEAWKALEEEGIRCVKSTSKKWKPAKSNGKKVRCRYILPILYRLNK
ncbi:MAG: energy transducer TonB [Bacteroidaceae bacterium]|nr:energy transducer TonB [Bacteroidaceae bacterium]MBQ6050635.1 energy transducer TonB [Bacteroidaceae bacterium]